MTTDQSTNVPSLDETSRATVRQQAVTNADAATRSNSTLKNLFTVPWQSMGIIFLLSVTLRLYQETRSYDIFIDEITYANISRNLAHGSGLTLYGQPFDLHPPVGFLTWAAVLRLFSMVGPVLSIIDQLRAVSAVFGALVSALIYLIVRGTVSSQATAWCAGLLMALDPFANSFDSLVVLEPEAQFFTITAVALIGAAVLTTSISRHRMLIVAAGLATALTMCTKETFGLVIGLTVLILVVSGWVVPRRDALLVGAIGLVGYGSSILAVGFTSGFVPWWQAHASSFQRLVGTKQITGFNAPSTKITVASQARADVTQYASTYAVLVVGGLISLVLIVSLILSRQHNGVFRRVRESMPDNILRRRLLILTTIWTASACGYLAYATIFGSIEEKMYYIPLAPCLIETVYAGYLLFRRPTRLVRITVAFLLFATVAFDSAVWVQIHTRYDNSYGPLVQWSQANVAPGSTISATEDVAHFLLSDVRLGSWTSVTALKAHHVDYVIISTRLTKQGYGTASPQFLQYLSSHAPLAYSVYSSQNGDLRVYDVRALTGNIQ